MSTCDEFREKNGREEGERERNRDAINGLTSNPNNDRRIEFSFYKLSWRGEGKGRDRDRFREKCQSESLSARGSNDLNACYLFLFNCDSSVIRPVRARVLTRFAGVFSWLTRIFSSQSG